MPFYILFQTNPDVRHGIPPHYVLAENDGFPDLDNSRIRGQGTTIPNLVKDIIGNGGYLQGVRPNPSNLSTTRTRIQMGDDGFLAPIQPAKLREFSDLYNSIIKEITCRLTSPESLDRELAGF